MTMRLDLRKRPDPAQPGRAMLEKTIISPRPFGCADCGQWFQFAPQLMAHVCQARGIEYHGSADV